MRERTSPLLAAVVRALERAALPAGTSLLAAVSGGPDSTALASALAEIVPARRLGMAIGHVEHGLRGAEGAADAGRVAGLAAALGVPFVQRAIALPPGADLEARARRGRYQALRAMADEAGAAYVVVGHTRDDQVETLLFRLLRGAGRRGLGGMRPLRGRILRPMLDASRADVRRYLADRGLPFVVDRTNADMGRTRNRLRRLLVPFLVEEFNPNLGPALAALAARLRDEDDFLAAAAAARAPAHRAGEALSVRVGDEPPALARRIVRDWLHAGGSRTASAGHVERVLALARGALGGAVAVPGGARVVAELGMLHRRPGRQATATAFVLAIAPGGRASHPDGAWRLCLSAARPRTAADTPPASAEAALFDADLLPPALAVRGPAPGDRIRVLGNGTRKVQNVLVDAKVPREQRPTVPLLVAGGDVLWIAGLVRGATAPVGPATRRVVAATLDRNV